MSGERLFEIVVQRAYETRIVVTATSAAAARQQVAANGILEACSDFPRRGEELTVERIKSARAA